MAVGGQPPPPDGRAVGDLMAGCTDPATEIVASCVTAMLWSFDPEGPCPPAGGGSTAVRFFAGDIAPPSVWNTFSDESGCKGPFLWVRAMQRYRTKQFPEPAITGPCEGLRVLPVELGVARCALTEESPTWEELDDEADVSLDDSWHIEQALCKLRQLLNKGDYKIATGTVDPYGPTGGIIQWTGLAYVGFA